MKSSMKCFSSSQKSMKKIKNLIFLCCVFFVGLGSAFATGNSVCKGIKLNTKVPFVGDCIGTTASSTTTQLNAFPHLMGGLMKLVMVVILVMSLLMIVVAGVMMTTGGFEKSNYSKGMDLIKKVAYGLALLGASGVILKLINPNFFI